MAKQSRNKFDKSYKEHALELLSQGRKPSHLANELGIPVTYLYRWKREANQYDKQVRFSGNGTERLTEEQRRIKELEKQLTDARLEQEILKKAIGIFSQSDRKGTGS